MRFVRLHPRCRRRRRRSPRIPAPKPSSRRGRRGEARARLRAHRVTTPDQRHRGPRHQGQGPPSKNALEWFVNEQREEVSSMDTLLRMVKRAGETGALLRRELPAAGWPPSGWGAGRRGRCRVTAAGAPEQRAGDARPRRRARSPSARRRHEYYVLDKPDALRRRYDKLFRELQALERDHPELRDGTRRPAGRRGCRRGSPRQARAPRADGARSTTRSTRPSSPSGT